MPKKQLFMLTTILIVAVLLNFTCTGYALTIAGEAIPSTMDGYFSLYPDTETIQVYNESDFIRDALEHSDAIDVYFLFTLQSTIYESLKNKGYFLNLDDPQITAWTESIYPEIAEAMLYKDELCAVPYAVVHQPGMGVYMDTWKKLGFTEKDLPHTWGQFMHFIVEKWPNLSQQYPNIQLFAETDYAYPLLQNIGNNYEAYRAKHNYEFGYATAEFREILELFQHLPSNQEDMSESVDEYLFNCGYTPTVREDWANIHSLQLSFKEDEDVCSCVGMLVMAVNPNTQHKDEALELIHYVIRNIDIYDKMELCPSENEPVISEIYVEAKEEYDTRMNDFTKKLESVDSEIESKAIEVERDSYDQDMQDFLEKYKYDPSLDSIQQYREEVDSVMVPVYRTGLSSEEYRSINEKRILFLNGQITIDQYITELERRFVFSVFENQ